MAAFMRARKRFLSIGLALAAFAPAFAEEADKFRCSLHQAKRNCSISEARQE